MKIFHQLTKRILPLIIISVVSAIIFFSACESEETSDFVQVAEVASTQLGADLDATYLFSVFHRCIHDTALINNDTAVIDSAWVYRSFDQVSGGATYVIDYGVSTISPDFNLKTGQIQATLDKPFTEDSATFEATFTNFTIGNMRLAGSAKYINTGEVSGSRYKYILQSQINYYLNDQIILAYEGEKTIWWTEGYLKPEDFDSHKFAIEGTSTGTYSDPENTMIPEAGLSLETDGELDVSLSCHKLIKYGRLLINESLDNRDELITGDFVDSDIDGCSDKVMLKNNRNFGYPYYF